MGSAPELIEAGGPSSVGGFGKIAAGLGMAVLVTTGGLEALAPPSKVRLMGAEADEARRAALDVRWGDGGRARAVETNFRLRGRVRRWVSPYWAALMLRLRDVPTDALIVGDDGWLFFRKRALLKEQSRERGGATLANVLGAVRRSLAVHGTELIAAPLPRKSVVLGPKLPAGIDPTPDYDRWLVHELEARGIRTLDLVDRWTGSEAETIYLRQDSHWAQAGVRTFSEEVRRQLPNLPRDVTQVEAAPGKEIDATGLLFQAGLLPGHPALRFAGVGGERSLTLLPPGRAARINGGEEPSEVLLVGSSFSEGYGAQAMLSRTLQAPVAGFSHKGRPPLFSLHGAITAREPGDLQRFVIAEFPVHQAAGVNAGSSATMLGCIAILEHLTLGERAEALPAALFPGASRSKATVNVPYLRYPGGSLLSSGDGVLALRMSVTGERPSRWRFACSGMTVAFRIPPGSHTKTLPIIEAEGPEGVAWLMPLDEAAVAVAEREALDVKIVTDVDLTGARNLAVSRRADGAWVGAGPIPVNHLDALVLQWEEGTPGAGLTIVAEGSRPNSQLVTRTWRFEKADPGRVCVLTMGPFEGGQMHRVEVHGPHSGLSLRLGAVRQPR